MIIDYNAKSDKEIRAIFNDNFEGEDCCDEGNPPYDYSEDIVFKCLKNPSDNVQKRALSNYPINEKYCDKISTRVLNHVAHSGYSARFLKDRLSLKQKIKIAQNDVSSLEHFSLPVEELDKIFTQFCKAGMPQVSRYIIPHCPEKIDEYIRIDANVIYALSEDELSDEFIDRYIDIAPTQILYAINQTRVTSEMAIRAVKANPDTYLIIPEEVNNMQIRAYIYDNKPILLAKRSVNDRQSMTRRLMIFNEEIMMQIMERDPKEIIDWISTNRDSSFKKKVTPKFYKKYVEAVEANHTKFYIPNLLKEDHSPEFIDSYMRHDFNHWRVVTNAGYTLTEDQISFLVTEHEREALVKRDEKYLERFLCNLKSSIHSYSEELVLKHPNLIFGCKSLNDDLFEKIYDRVTSLSAATVIYNRSELDHVKLYLKLKFG